MLTIAIPTLGRPTLEATLHSLAGQLTADDELIIVADPAGDPARAAEILDAELVPGAARFEVIAGDDDWGHAQRNWAIDHAAGDYIWALADDDIAEPGAVEALRAATNAGGWHLFQVESRGELGDWRIPDDKIIRETNVDAECILAPRDAAARWGSRYQGDLDYALDLLAELGEPSWHDTVVARLRPATEKATA